MRKQEDRVLLSIKCFPNNYMANFLTNTPKNTAKSQKRLGRGYGSGKGGHTSGRGQKGQKTRKKIPLLFTGTKTKKSLIQRLPKLRGKGKFKSLNTKPLIIQLNELNKFKPGSEVTLEAMVQIGLIKHEPARKRGVKILNQGQLTKKLQVLVPVSQSVKEKIEAIGGE